MDGQWTSPAVGGGHYGGPDPEYARVTREMLEKDDRRQAEEASRREAAKPPTPSPRQSADMLKNAPAFYAMSAMGPSGLGLAHDLATHEALLADFLAEAGAPSDRLERLLLEQIHLAQHAVGRLHVKAGLSTDPQAIVTLLGGAARFTAELRRLVLALEAYRVSSETRKAKQAEKKRAARRTAAADGRRVGRGRDDDKAHAEVGSNNRVKGYFDELQPALS